MYYTTIECPFCEIILVGDEQGLTNLHLETREGKRIFNISSDWVFNHEFFVDVIQQINEYFAGERRTFELKLNPAGTDFQLKVWRQLQMIPFGETRCYKDIAVALGNPNASRAIGMANSKNPIPLIIPCHRVVGANGKLTGFAHGLTIKEQLLSHEQ